MAPAQLEGRAAWQRGSWQDAYRLLGDADRADPLGREDLELLATSAYLIGRDDEFCETLARAHRAHAEAGDPCRAARCGFWLGLTLTFRGETAQASGWLARAERLVVGIDCAEQGYVLLPKAERQLGEGAHDAAYATASRAAAIGERCTDADLIACARHLQGRALVEARQLHAGLVLLDEAMVAVVAGELTPIMTGLIYCSVIEKCQEVYALSRARQWTDALAKWCEAHPQMNAFRGSCLVCRAEILQTSGAWSEAMAEATRACERFSRSGSAARSAPALYQQAELHRLRGELAPAEEAYRAASRFGWEPQPGLALLRLAQGRSGDAAIALGRVLATTTDPFARAKLLAAYVEILLAAHDRHGARIACDELDAIAEQCDADAPRAMAAHARGALELADGDPRAALAPLRRAFAAWHALDIPYEVARVRVLSGLACRALGDHDAADLELATAREVFEALGARADLARLDARAAPPATTAHPLSARELEVLRLVAAGKTNKEIANVLFVSERTIDRHVSNILTKLDVPSRAAATAYAITHHLIP